MALSEQKIEQYRAKYGLNKPTLDSNQISQYRQKYGLESRDANTPFNVEPRISPDVTKAQKIAEQTSGFQQEADKYKGLGLVKEFGKELVSNIAPGEVGLGKTISAIVQSKDTKGLDAQLEKNRIQADLLRRIRERESQGQNVTRLKQAYNELIGTENYKPVDLPSTGQVVGQLGQTALDLGTAGTYGKATQGLKSFKLGSVSPSILSAVTKPTGLGTARGLGKIGTGAGIGYGYDVTSGLMGIRGEDREGAKALIPGIGTVAGATIPTITETTQTIKNIRNPEVKVNKIVDKRTDALSKVTDNYATLRKVTSKAKDRGFNVVEDIANTDLLVGSVDNTDLLVGSVNNTGTIRTENAIAELNDIIAPAEKVIRQNLEKEGRKLPVKFVEKELKKKVTNSNLEGNALVKALKNVDNEIQGYLLRADADGYIPLYKIHDAKVNKYATINYMNPTSKQGDKVIAKALKELVENHSKSTDVKSRNKELTRFFIMQDFLEKLDGKKVQGGKLGKYFAQTIGGIVGSHFGPVGTIIGAELGGRIRGNALSKAFGGTSGKQAVRSPLLEKAIESGKPNPTIQLPQSSNSLGSRNTNQTATIIPTINPGIPLNSTINNEIGNPLINTLNKVKQKIDETPNKQGGFIKIGKEVPTESPLPKGNQSVSSLNNTTDLKTKNQVILKDIQGNKVDVKAGTVLKSGEKGSNYIVEIDGNTYTINKGQYQNLKGNSVVSEAKEFAPELKDTIESIRGESKTASFNMEDYEKFPPEVTKIFEKYGDDSFAIEEALKKKGYEVDITMGGEINSFFKKGETPAKYSQYTLPNGENYREILIQAPDTRKAVSLSKIESVFDLQDFFAKQEFGENHFYKLTQYQKQQIFDNPRYSKLHDKLQKNKVINERFDITDEGIKSQSTVFKSSHWDEPNVLAHIRLNERTYKDNKVTFVEEIQSDWAREGREKGFQLKEITKKDIDLKFIKSEIPEGANPANYPGYWEAKNTINGELIGRYPGNTTQEIAMERAIEEINFYNSKKIPNNSLLKNWQETTIKRALKDAVDNNADYFAWINGEQTSARYNLATYVDDVEWGKSGTIADKKIYLKPKSGDNIIIRIEKDGSISESSQGDWEGKKLDEVLGKGLADKIMSKNEGTLSGDGLKFGGEWANNLYDKQVPNIVKDLTGAKVETLDLGLPSGNGKFKIEPANRKGWFNVVDESGKMIDTFENKASAERAIDSGELRKFGKKTTQQGIKLTPEVKAIIKGEAPKFKPAIKRNTNDVNITIPLVFFSLMGGALSGKEE